MKGKQVLLIVDMITAWDFEGADKMAADAAQVVPVIGGIKDFVAGEIEIAYANDLEDGFHGSREMAVAAALSGRHPELVEPLVPAAGDAFIHKGQHSAFYGTPLAHLLKLSGADGVILTGQVTEQCILYTALDAHVRGYEITVTVDAVVSQDERLGTAALEMIERNMNGRLTTSAELLAAISLGSA